MLSAGESALLIYAPLNGPRDYSQAIRLEYAHVSDEAFREGQEKVMAGFLERPIYRTGWSIGREERARENIARELGRLRSGDLVQPIPASPRLHEPVMIQACPKARGRGK